MSGSFVTPPPQPLGPQTLEESQKELDRALRRGQDRERAEATRSTSRRPRLRYRRRSIRSDGDSPAKNP